MTGLSQKQHYLLVGTYTGEKSKGIYVYRFGNDGSAEEVDAVATPNPSYIAISPDQQFVYAVNELGNAEGGGKVSAFHFDKNTGKLRLLNQQSAEGEHPCYITIDSTGRWVIVGNYSSGNLSVLPVREDGSLGESTTTVQHYGSSTHKRQEKPHVHATVLSANNRFLYVPDLGIDKLMIYSFDALTGKLRSTDSTLKMKAGAGPRHFVFHPNQQWAYLLQELSGDVTVFKNEKGSLQPIQTLSVLPSSFNEPFTSADIRVSPDGKFLYTSTRDNANLLTGFRIHPSNGTLTIVGHEETLGNTPRNFNFDPSGNFLLVANQSSDEIVIFRMNKKTGKLDDTTKRIAVGSPVCLQWISINNGNSAK